MESEVIKTFWRFGYFKLFNDGYDKYVSLDDGYEWRQIFWRFYWRLDV